jgi:DNA-binding CsgD family transcriptional regulator
MDKKVKIKSTNTKAIRLKDDIINLIKEGKTTLEIQTILNISDSTIRKIAKANNLTISKPKSIWEKPKRNKQIIDLINQNYTYQQIADKFNITKQRVYQIAKANDISIWSNIRTKHNQIYNDIITDINNNTQYNDIKKKHNLERNNLNYIFKKYNNKTPYTIIKDKRNTEISNRFISGNTAKTITNTTDNIITSPNKLISINSIYNINTKNNVKRFPLIYNRSKGGIFERKEIRLFIKKKRDKDNWSFRKIAEELNKLNHKTITGKEYTTANTYRLYKDITNKKKIRTYFN